MRKLNRGGLLLLEASLSALGEPSGGRKGRVRWVGGGGGQPPCIITFEPLRLCHRSGFPQATPPALREADPKRAQCRRMHMF